jgi:hypothetical protein
VLPQLVPPTAPGTMADSVSAGGVNMPVRAFEILSRQAARSASVISQGVTSSGFTTWRADGGSVEKGCVGQDCSPGISLFGTARSSMGHTGLPVTRSNTNTKPCLVACATASMRLPPLRTVSSCGAAVGS